MQNRRKPARFLGIFFGFVLGISLLSMAILAQGPDRNLHFVRTVPSQLDPERIDRNVSAVSRWPQWFYSTSEVQIENSNSGPEQQLRPGSRVIIKIDPRK